MDTVEEVSSFLRSKSIIIPSNNYWLKSCVECFKEQGNYNLTQLKELVYQQWLLADLADIGVNVLPESCLCTEKTILNGRYAVQLNFFVNIGVSFHKQLQKIRKPDVIKNLEVDCENTSNNKVGANNRIYKIEITDGVLTVVGFEDHFIPILQEPLVPGKKAILVGPLECRKGILFLRPKNIIVLGGEVDGLHIPNATENILARALKLPVNPDPYNLNAIGKENEDAIVNARKDDGVDDDEEAMIMLAEVIENEVSSDVPCVDSNHNPNQSQNKYNNISEQENLQTILQPCVNNKKTTQSHHNSLKKNEFDNVTELQKKLNFDKITKAAAFDDDFDLLEEPTFFSRQSVQSENSNYIDSSRNMSDCQLIDITSSKKQYEEIALLKKKLNESYGANENMPSSSTSNLMSEKSSCLENKKIIVDYLSEAESPLLKLTGGSEMSDCTSSPSIEINDSENFFNSEPFPPKKRPAIVKTPARVVKVLKKPKLKDDKWFVNAIVAARGIELEVSFASDVIDKIFTISAAEIISRRAELISDPAMKQKMNETLKNSQVRFSTLSCIMVFNFKDAISKPVIIGVQ